MQHKDIERVLISQQQIAQRVAELARQITTDHSPPNIPADGQLAIIPILTGAMMFCSDLIRHMPLAMNIGLLTVSSYPGSSVRSLGASVLARQLGNLRGKYVLLVDDILDSGGTLNLVVPMLREMEPAGVKTCVLLRKKRPEIRQSHADYVGFEIPDEFVVGYGLDYNNYYRNLPDIVTLKAQALKGSCERQTL